MIYYDLMQLTPEWYQMRTGAVTSSRLNDVMAKLVRKEGEAAARRKYRMESAVARLTGRIVDHYVSTEMEWGIEQEPIARTEYEIATGNEVTPIGGAQHDILPGLWASTDGLIGEDGILEVKCPASTTHLDWIVAGVVPSEHHWQIIGGLACTGRRWCDFVSFDPRFENGRRLFIKRFERSQTVDQLIRLMELEVAQFLKEVNDLVAWFKDSPGSVQILQPGDKGELNPIGEGR